MPYSNLPSRLMLGLLISFDACAAGAVRTQTPEPVDPARMRAAEQAGSNLGDYTINSNQSPRWYGAPDQAGQVVINGEWVPVESLVPSTDGQDYVQKLKTHGNDKDIDGLRQLTEEEGDRLSKTTAGNGQAAMVMRNSAAKYPLQRRDFEQDQVLKDSAPILNDAAKSNLVLGEVFADCSTTTIAVNQIGSGPLTSPKACSYVELNQTPGYRGEIQRKVTIEQPYESQTVTEFITVAPGETLTKSGTISGIPSNASADYVTDFSALVSPQIIRPFYTVTITQAPKKTNGWTYSVDVHHLDSDSNSAQILFAMTYKERSDPVFTFTPTCIDGDCSIQGDEFCKAKWTCTEKAPLTVNGVHISAAVVREEPPLYPVDPADDPSGGLRDTALVCMRAHQDIDCSRIYSGTACWPADPNFPGSEGNCLPAPDNGLPNSCPELESDTSCTLVGQGCADGGQSLLSGFCYVKTKIFNCSSEIAIPEQTVKTQTQCSQYLSCVEGNCLSSDKAHETGYSRTQAAAQQVIVQHVVSDWSRPKQQVKVAPEVKAAREREEVRQFLERAKIYEAEHPESRQ